jgi:tetratricopeptide (TPR) repeat protein
VTSSGSPYFFRHAILRDAAYQLHLPGDRGRLHGLAVEVIESLCGGRPPEAPIYEEESGRGLAPHPTDPFACELAEHAALAASGLTGRDRAASQSVHETYLRRGAEDAERRFRIDNALNCWRQLSGLLRGGAAGEGNLRAGRVAYRAGRMHLAEQLYNRAVSLLRRCRHENLGKALSELAGVYKDTGRPGLAKTTLDRVRKIQERSGGGAKSGTLSLNEGLLLMDRGQPKDAARRLGQAVAAFREAHDRRKEGMALSYLAHALGDQGRVDDSRRVFHLALRIHRCANDRRYIGITIGNLANPVARICDVLMRRAARFRPDNAGELYACAILRKTRDEPFREPSPHPFHDRVSEGTARRQRYPTLRE